MDIIGKFFNNAISKRVSEVLASTQATNMASAVSMMNLVMNSSLPTINPDNADYYSTFKTIGAVYEVTDAISKKFLNCPPVYYKVKDKKLLQRSKLLFKSDPIQSHVLKMQATEEVDIPELTTLLTNGMANPYQTGTQFRWSTVLSYLLHGNTYVHPITGGGRAKELYCFPNMKIAADLDDLLDPIRGYILQTTEMIPFDKSEIQHIKTGTPAPIDRTMEYLYGVAPLRAYLESIRAIKEGKSQATKQAKNGGAFGMLSPKNKEDQLSPEQKDQLMERLKDARKSNDELARLFPSSISMDFLNIGLSIADLQLLELVSASEEDVYRAYHMPLQFHNQKASTSNNQKTAVVQMIYDAVAPVCDTMGEAFTICIGKGYGVTIDFDYTQLPEMAVNSKEVADYLNSLPKGVLTPNEMRAALKYGESKEAYMNEYYVEGNLTTLKRVSEGTSTPITPNPTT